MDLLTNMAYSVTIWPPWCLERVRTTWFYNARKCIYWKRGNLSIHRDLHPVASTPKHNKSFLSLRTFREIDFIKENFEVEYVSSLYLW